MFSIKEKTIPTVMSVRLKKGFFGNMFGIRLDFCIKIHLSLGD